MTQTLTIALPKAAVWVRDAIRADRANAYGLDAPWTLPRLGGDLRTLDLIPPDYFDESWHIVDGVITEMPFAVSREACDGCTLSPDYWPRTWGGVKAYVGALFHDRWYKWMEKFAKAWGWTEEKVRKLGDVVFGNILRAFVKRLRGLSRVRGEIACRVYYGGVRAFGGAGRAAYKRFEGSKVRKFEGSKALAIAVTGSLLLGGCAGCAIPTAWDDPDAEIEIPAHSYSNLVTGASWSYTPIPQASGIGAYEQSDPAGATESAGLTEGDE